MTKERNSNSDDESLPAQIGPYRILDTLGEGGMSVVYLAEQSEPVKRRVALKILKPGMDSKQIVARFESERQALAVLDHPNIAKIFDGGIAESGRPYFVMEQVKGVPITDYCDHQRLSNEERLDVFIKVCSAVQHAHLKGLIHRDLKPSNILVGVVDREPQPKIIDFGIAKATTTTLTDSTLHTRIGQIIGTPQYMSPEQANVTGLDVDTRADIYSLGVVLYELLVGATPLDLQAIGDQAIQVAIREKDPPKPSTRITELGDTQFEIAKARNTDIHDLRRQLRGDLDWIVMRAIEKDRTRRYETANALAMECRRVLRSEPVLARPPSPGYLLQRFVRRNRLAVVAGSVAILAIIGGATAAALGYIRATEAEQVARQEAETAQQVSDFLVDLFEVSDPSEARGNTITAREVLDRGALTIEQELAGELEIQATLMLIMGRVHHNLGLFDEAKSLLDRALERRRQFDDADDEIAAVLQRKAMLAIDRGEFEEAEQLAIEAITLVETSNADPHDMAKILWTRATVYQSQARYAEAEADLSRALLLLQSLEAAQETDIADILNRLAVIYRRTDRYEEAKATFLKALDIRERELGPDHPAVSTTLNSLSILHVRLKEWDEAEKLMLRVIAVREKVFGAQHPRLAVGLNNLAGLYIVSGRPEQAVAYLERALEIRESTLDPNHPSLGEAAENLAVLHLELKDYETAMNWVKRSISIKEASLDSDHPDLAMSLKTYADILREFQRFDEAELFYLRALDIEERRLGIDHPQTKSTLESYALLLRATDRAVEADEIATKLEQQAE